MFARTKWDEARVEFGALLLREVELKEALPDEPRDVDTRLGNWLGTMIGDAQAQLTFLLQIVDEWSAERIRRLLKAMPSRRKGLAKAVKARHSKRYHPDTGIAIALYLDDDEDAQVSGDTTQGDDASIVHSAPVRSTALVLVTSERKQNPIVAS